MEKVQDSPNGGVVDNPCRQSYGLYQEPWWLDTVAPGEWEEVVIRSGGTTVARLPYVIRQRRGFTRLEMPQLCQFLGPWINPGEGKYVTRLAREHELLQQLIDGLPRFAVFRQAFAPQMTNWLPFFWSGFESDVRINYRIESLANLDVIWGEMRENIRREIRKAQKTLIIRDDLNLAHFIDVSEKTFARQGRTLPLSRSLIERVDHECRRRKTGKILFAVDSGSRIHGAVYYIWTADTCYYLMSGADPELRNSGATSLLVWEGMQLAHRTCKAFDFEGSMIPGIERFMRSCGARQVPFLQVSRYSRPVRVVRGIAASWQALRGGR